MSREPWNTGAAQPRGYAAKSPLTKGSRIILLQRERGSCAFPCFRRGRVWAEPRIRVKGRVPCGFLGQRPKPSESRQHTISPDFQGSFDPFYIGSVFHRSLDTTLQNLYFAFSTNSLSSLSSEYSFFSKTIPLCSRQISIKHIKIPISILL